ncbi:uncharacterized protein KY384_001549 [Bacidia gigantensis]|uniref:uncharacterized protein n=1 Tax=Bacidia gigantensis TaxID=2732470 RepID=UPI001D03CF78|nr:uncharacterized protein KY384_001549 [Bacidia gigantensis]KAG8533808.1 hypothetical protein KY384_001549 [Bacidia gigantensis]
MATPAPEPLRNHPFRSRNPLPLSAAQEAQVQQLYHKRVRDYCADEIRGPKEEDLAREEYFAGVEQRIAEKREKERKAAEAERFHREWWELDENGMRKKRT